MAKCSTAEEQEKKVKWKGKNSLTSIDSVSLSHSLYVTRRFPASCLAYPTDRSSQTPRDERHRWTLWCHHTEKFIPWYSAQHLFSYPVPLKLLCQSHLSSYWLWNDAQIWVINNMQHSKLAFFYSNFLGISLLWSSGVFHARRSLVDPLQLKSRYSELGLTPFNETIFLSLRQVTHTPPTPTAKHTQWRAPVESSFLPWALLACMGKRDV